MATFNTLALLSFLISVIIFCVGIYIAILLIKALKIYINKNDEYKNNK